MSTNLTQTREEFLAARKLFVGGSDIASVMNRGRYACARKLAYDKFDTPKDIDDSDKMEFRRGKRLEGIASDYYEQKTGREVRYTATAKVPGKPHLAVNIDRLVKKPNSEEWGYLEIKVVGRNSWFKIKKEGLIDDYVLQLQYGMAVTTRPWGAYAIYCPDLDELMEWDVVADKDLGKLLLEAADDFWNLNIENRILPEQLPEDSPPCSGCAWSLTCRGKVAQTAGEKVIVRPDLEPLVEKFREIKGMQSESTDAADSLREEILEKIGRRAGSYQFGRFSATFTAVEQKRFNGEELKKRDPALYESLRKTSVVETFRVKE